ncbi:MAG: hypothetical protein V1753_10455 [Pseudomonadota bacterium]
MDKKLEILKKYLAATVKLEKNIESRDLQAFLSCLEERGQYIKDIKRIDSKIDNSLKKENLNGATREYIKEFERLAKQIKLYDEHCESILKKDMKLIREGILHLQQSRHAMTGYGKTGEKGGAKFFSITG